MKRRVCAIKWSPGDGSIWQTAMIRHVAHRRRQNSISVFCRLPKSMQTSRGERNPFLARFCADGMRFRTVAPRRSLAFCNTRSANYYILPCMAPGDNAKHNGAVARTTQYYSARAAISTERNYSGQPLRGKSGLYLCAGQWYFWPRAFSLFACQFLRSRLGMKVLNASERNKAHC